MRLPSDSRSDLFDMTNLLTAESLSRQRAEYRNRFLIVFAVLSLVCALIALLALVPAYVVVQAADVPASEADANAPSNDAAELTRSQTLLNEVVASSATSSAETTIGDVLAMKPAAVTVTAISYTKSDPKAKKASLILSGTSARASAVEFRDALIASKRFDAVSVPVSVLVGAESGSFSVLLTGKF